jgi:hypothetical protein
MLLAQQISGIEKKLDPKTKNKSNTANRLRRFFCSKLKKKKLVI